MTALIRRLSGHGRAWAVMFTLVLAGASCRSQPAAATPTPPRLPVVLPTPTHPAHPTAPVADTTAVVRPSPTATTAPTPFYDGSLSEPCGVVLPPLPQDTQPVNTSVNPDDAALSVLRERIPPSARPALERLLSAPGDVALVAYQVSRESTGVYWNADTLMPLASVAKVITLVAYAEAVAAGELNPQEPVALSELDRFFLPNSDLGTHRRAVTELRDTGRLILPESDDPAVTLEDVAWMMVRHSSNAAGDYLQQRLGQRRIETTATRLGLTAENHTAPCPFLGQFLMMSNHVRGLANDSLALAAYASASDAFGSDLSMLADAYSRDAVFRERERDWRATNRRPSIETQRVFVARYAPQGTARAYADLMARLAQNGLSDAESSFIARRRLEWPMQFADNQALFSNLGYKNGSLPGVLTTVYYAYRWGDAAPVVVALFYRDLPQQTYRRWREELPHDEFARLLLTDPEVIPLLAESLRSVTSSTEP